MLIAIKPAIEFILADEPTGNLDPQTSVEVLDVLKKINLPTEQHSLWLPTITALPTKLPPRKLQSGVLARGDIVALCATSGVSQQVSPATVFQAYYLLGPVV